MIKFSLKSKDLECQIAAETNDAESIAAIAYSGDKSLIKEVKSILSRSYGMFGHRIDTESCAPIDLNAAIFSVQSQLKALSPKLIEGQEILDAWEPSKLPEGAIY